MEGAGRRSGASIVGGIAVVAGAALLLVAAGHSGPARPQVLGETLVAPSTTTTPSTVVAVTSESSVATTVVPVMVEPVSVPPTTTAAAPPTSFAPTTATTRPPRSTTTTARKCPSGAPVAVVRSWEASTGDGGVWHVIVTGVVSNRTGASTVVDRVALTVERASGHDVEIDAAERPVPDPQTIADRAEATWRWEGDVVSGPAPKDAHAMVAGWRWVDASPGCRG